MTILHRIELRCIFGYNKGEQRIRINDGGKRYDGCGITLLWTTTVCSNCEVHYRHFYQQNSAGLANNFRTCTPFRACVITLLALIVSLRAAS